MNPDLSTLAFNNRTYQLMGSISAVGADIDRYLTKILCILANASDPDRVLPLVRGRSVGDKIAVLSTVLPATILDASAFISHLRTAAEHRNQIAHSSLDYHFEDIASGTPLARAFGRENRKGSSTLPIDHDELTRRDVRQKIVSMACGALLLHLVTEPDRVTCIGDFFSSSELEQDTHVVITNAAVFSLAMEMFPIVVRTTQ